MVVVFYKAFALVLKVFTKPLVDYTKKVHLRRGVQTTHPMLRQFFIRMGNRFAYYEQLINQKFLKIQTSFAFKPLNNQLAIEKGINFTYQLLFYLIIIAIPIYQLNRASIQSKEKKNQLQEKLKNMKNRLTYVLKQIQHANQQKARQRTIVHPWISKNKITNMEILNNKQNQKKQIEPMYKFVLQFPNKRTHIYHIDYFA